MSDVLTKICDDTRKHVAAQKAKVSEATLIETAKNQFPTRGFRSDLQKAVDKGHFGLIAEIKKASPSKGLIREDFQPELLAIQYEAGGATCLSVLTDEPYFQGRDDYLMEARGAVGLPVIRKDFMVDPYQVVESRAIGADCILVIMAAVDDALAAELKSAADDWGMDVLVEVHNEEEMERANTLSPALLGINNRNLKTLEVNLSTTETLAPLANVHSLLVSESGLYTNDDLQRMSRAGINCFLVGESLMRQENVALAVQNLLGSSKAEQLSDA